MRQLRQIKWVQKGWDWIGAALDRGEQAFKAKRAKQLLILIAITVATAMLLVSATMLIPAVLRLDRDKQTVHKTPTEENKREYDASLEHVKAIISGIGTLATIGAGVVLFLNFRVANRNAELAEDKQVTERFSKAIEHIGNTEQIQVRLGGIYSLERIAKDSPDDLWTIIEVLSAFTREATKTDLQKKKPLSLAAAALLEQPSKVNEYLILPTDIQAAFTVINQIYPNRTTEHQIDLARIDLSRADLSGANLSRADLSGAKLSGADLSGTKLSRSILLTTDLRSARNLEESQLDQAYLCNVGLPAELTGIDKNRDCDKIPELLVKRYRMSLDNAKQTVAKAKQKQWN